MKIGGIEENPFGDDPFQEFTTALEEGDGLVHLRHLVIYFTGFGDGDCNAGICGGLGNERCPARVPPY